MGWSQSCPNATAGSPSPSAGANTTPGTPTMPRSPRNTSCGPVSASRDTASRALLTSGGRANALVGLTALHRTADDHLRPSVVGGDRSGHDASTPHSVRGGRPAPDPWIAPHAPDLG